MLCLPEPQEIETLVRAAVELPGLAPVQARIHALVADYARGHQAQDRALVVALIGATGAGKSTLLNALAGADVAREGVDRPTSTRAVIYAPDDALLGGLEHLETEVRRYRVRADPNSWAGQVFVDTPDSNSVEASHRQRAWAVLAQADVAVVVLHRGSVVEAAQIDFLAEFARRRRLLFALNFADQLGAAAQSELKEQVRRVAQEQFGLPDAPVFAVSALGLKRGNAEAHDHPALLAALRGLGTAALREKVRRSNAVAVLGELAETIAPRLADHQRAQQGVAEALAAGLEKTREALITDFEQRLAGAQAHLKSEVRRQASVLWWGPAAWWLRLSMLGAGGLGAASLVARRSLPVGLAVAAASTLVDRLQERTRARAAEDRVICATEAVEDDGTLTSAARASLVEARSRAFAAGLTPEALQLPDTPMLLELLAGVRSAAWRYAEGQALATTVGRWWRWARFLLVPLINLPLIALAGHVAYRVARAYLEGAYLGADYFLNAAALAALLSALGGWLASMSLSGVARGIRALAVARFKQSFDASRDELLAQVEGALGPSRAAGARLVELGTFT